MNILNKVKSFWVNKEWREMDKVVAVLIFNQVVLVISLFAWIGLMYLDWRIGLCVFLIMWGNNISHSANSQSKVKASERNGHAW